MFGVIYKDHLHIDLEGRVAIFQTRDEAQRWARWAEIVPGDLKVVPVEVIVKETQ